METISVKRINTKNELDTAFQIRKEVFVFGQGVPAEEEYDVFDETATHYLALVAGVPVGTARWRETPNGVKLERFAVLENYRNLGVGKVLVDEVMRDVPKPNLIYLHAQLPAMNVYKRAGFITEGELFLECDIEHYKMVQQV